MSENTSREENKGSGQQAQAKSDAKGVLSQLEAILDEYMVTKAPFALPQEVKEFIVKVSPYLVIIFAVMALPLRSGFLQRGEVTKIESGELF